VNGHIILHTRAGIIQGDSATGIKCRGSDAKGVINLTQCNCIGFIDINITPSRYSDIQGVYSGFKIVTTTDPSTCLKVYKRTGRIGNNIYNSISTRGAGIGYGSVGSNSHCTGGVIGCD